MGHLPKDILPINLDYFQAAAERMPTDHFGPFMLLSMHYWRTDRVPSDRQQVATICGVREPASFRTVLPTLEHEFKFGDAFLEHSYLDSLKLNFPRLGYSTGRPYEIGWRRLRLFVLERDAFTCQYCFAVDVPLDCDHVIPLSRGGLSIAENLVAACAPCNRSKKDRTPEEWRNSYAKN